MSNAGSINVKWQAEMSKFMSDMGKAQGQLQESISSAEQLGKTVRKTGAIMTAAGGAIVGASTLMVSNYSKVGDEVHKMALRTGMSEEAISSWRVAAQLAGTDIKAVETGMKRMQRSVIQLGDGLAESTRSFDRLGLTLEDIENLAPEDQMETIMKRMADIEDPTKRAAIAQEIFGRAGTQLLPVLEDGAEGLDELLKKAEETGRVFDGPAAKAAADYQDELFLLKDSFGGLTDSIAQHLMPMFTDFYTKLRGLITVAREWIQENEAVVRGVSQVVLGFGAALAVIGPMTMAMGQLIIMTKGVAAAKAIWHGITLKLVAAKTLLMAKVLAVVGAIGLFIGAGVTVVRQWEDVSEMLGGVWDLIVAGVQNLYFSVLKIFHQLDIQIYNVILSIMDRMSVFESLPFGVGDAFKGMADSVRGGVEDSEKAIEELDKKSDKASNDIINATGRIGEGFKGLRDGVSDDVGSIIGLFTGMKNDLLRIGKEQNEGAEELRREDFENEQEFQQARLERYLEFLSQKKEADEISQEEYDAHINKLNDLDADRLEYIMEAAETQEEIYEEIGKLLETRVDNTEAEVEREARAIGTATGNIIDGNIASAISGLVSHYLQTLGPVGIALAAAAPALVRRLMPDVPSFADGGIVSGPTIGVMGEYPGVKSNPEVIAPLDKLQGMVGGGGNVEVNVNIDKLSPESVNETLYRLTQGIKQRVPEAIEFSKRNGELYSQEAGKS